ncbi:hypothetical protein KAFR_0G01820 [Kazachstania africana CBS 2517]|uniref:Uncharacterized protein n=1 Tax=Kazachstania africana (strain ATCC 22294 / BCRC 22015 / CBS 2517 / CECT 1963 / NBRC 1671 / NRRL Y-8276) TaxID=1071382 RepID=H2AXW6_KAZAF|nr:hypothetical protein KAFR_0G01820 [Kazachstania africana CBS 2517]CCF59216.1 hypothetical protein KAFR_0G01820 [Kazachstania africana CBS 2517]
MSQAKIQILITDLSKDSFASKLPSAIEKKIFAEKFPELSEKLTYFTPLPFLNRIIIILKDEESASKIFKFLEDFIPTVDPNIKLYLTESLLVNSRPRAKSDDPFSRGNQAVPSSKPFLSLNTNPFNTGIASESLAVGSPSLSPDRSSLESPTLLKFSDNSKPYYYKEPLPKVPNDDEETGLPIDANDSFTPITSTTSTWSRLDTGDKRKNLRLDTDTNKNETRDDSPPKSPSITINHFTH